MAIYTNVKKRYYSVDIMKIYKLQKILIILRYMISLEEMQAEEHSIYTN